MGRRNDKGRAINAFLTGRTGIPMLHWDATHSRIDAPAPYSIKVTTDAAAFRFFETIRALPDTRTGIEFVIRYDKFCGTVDQAIVGMKLESFTRLLATHYETNHDRIGGK